MTDFLCVLDRTGAVLEPDLLRHFAAALPGYPGAAHEECRGPWGILTTTTPGRRSDRAACAAAATDPDTGVTSALVGHAHLVEGESINPGGGSPIRVTQRDALQGFLKDGTHFLSRTAGPFVFVSFDPRDWTCVIARCHLGECKVSYFVNRRWLIVASEPSAILRFHDVSRDIDERMVVRFLGFQFSQSEHTLFKDIRELPAAHWLKVTSSDCETGRYWRFSRRREVQQWSEEKVCADFTAHLRQSIAGDVDGVEADRVALSASGGLDSTTLAALMPSNVSLFSWYFERTPECDESENIACLSDYLQRPLHWVDGDGCYPLSGRYIDTFVNVNSPAINAFAGLKRRLYLAAQNEGCSMVMVGDGGDALYAARDYWLRDTLMHRVSGAYTSLWRTIQSALRGDEFAKLSLRRLLPVRNLRWAAPYSTSTWLTGTARSIMPESRLSPVLPKGPWRYRFDPAVGVKHIELESDERRLFVQSGICRSNPFWYWPLLEMVLSLPAHWYYRDGLDKVLTRRAMKGRLPERILNSGRIGLLGTFFLRGMEINQKYIRDTVFKTPLSDWQKFVDRSWVEPHLYQTGSISFGHTILWRVICYELWYRQLLS